MSDTQKDRQFTTEEKKKIYPIIYSLMEDDERHPRDIIRDDFGGDEDAYLRAIVKWLEIAI